MEIHNQTNETISTQESDSASKETVSIVIPCYNEEASIPNLATRLSMARESLANYTTEFIFVDDGSSDLTYDVLCDHFGGWENAKIVQHEENKGLMAAILTGFGHSQSELICTMDSDCTYDPLRMIDLLEESSQCVGLVTGSPYHPEGEVLNVPRWRIMISYIASWLYAWILRHQLYCYTSMFRVYRAEAIRGIVLENKGFVGNTELFWKVEQRGWKIVEVPSILAVRQFGQSKMNTAKVAVRHLRLMWTIVTSRFQKQSVDTCTCPQHAVNKA